MSIWKSIGTVFRKYAVFSGNAGRAEFWWWALASTAMTVVIATFTESMTGSTAPYAGLWSLAVFLPSLAVAVRRLRDAGLGWGHMFWLLLPFAGVLVVLILCAQPTVGRIGFGSATGAAVDGAR